MAIKVERARQLGLLVVVIIIVGVIVIINNQKGSHSSSDSKEIEVTTVAKESAEDKADKYDEAVELT